MNQYVYQSLMGRPGQGNPPPIYPYLPPVADPRYIWEKKELRRTGNLFGFGVILYFAVNFALSFAYTFLRQFGYQFFGRFFIQNTEVTYYLFNMVVYVLSFAVAFGLYTFLLKMPWKVAAPFRPVRPGTVWLAIPATFALSVVGSVLTSLLNALFSVTGFQPVMNEVLTPTTVPGTILYFVLLAVLPSIFEEIAFRGILMQSLRRFGDAFALIVSALLFGLFHLNMIQAPYAFLLGLWFGYLVLQTGSLRISMVLHACVNLSAGIMSILMKGMSQDMLVLVNLVYMAFWIMSGVACLLILLLRRKGALRLHPSQTRMSAGQKGLTFFTAIPMIAGLLLLLFFTLRNFSRI